jgi:hypothetical protein
MGTAIDIIVALASRIPELIAAWRAARAAGRDPGSITLSEFMSTDAVASIQDSIDKSEEFENRFRDG